MAIVHGYATRDDLKLWLEVTDAALDDLVDKAVNAASRGIDNYCKRHFYQLEDERRFDAGGPRVVQFGTWNDLATLDEVRLDVDGDGTAEVVADPSDLVTVPMNRSKGEEWPIRGLVATGNLTFPRGRRPGRVVVAGTWGWESVPDAVHEATLIQGARLLKRKSSPEGVVGLNMFGTVRMGRLDPDVKRMTKPYRIRTVG